MEKIHKAQEQLADKFEQIIKIYGAELDIQKRAYATQSKILDSMKLE